MKLCPKCESIMNENSYFGELICIRCNYKEPIHNNLWIEELEDKIEKNVITYRGDIIGFNDTIRIPNNEETVDKLNEVIKVLNKITNPRV